MLKSSSNASRTRLPNTSRSIATTLRSTSSYIEQLKLSSSCDSERPSSTLHRQTQLPWPTLWTSNSALSRPKKTLHRSPKCRQRQDRVTSRQSCPRHRNPQAVLRQHTTHTPLIEACTLPTTQPPCLALVTPPRTQSSHRRPLSPFCPQAYQVSTIIPQELSALIAITAASPFRTSTTTAASVTQVTSTSAKPASIVVSHAMGQSIGSSSDLSEVAWSSQA